MWQHSPTISKSSEQNGHGNSALESSSPPSISSYPRYRSTNQNTQSNPILSKRNQIPDDQQPDAQSSPYRGWTADWWRFGAAEKRLHESASMASSSLQCCSNPSLWPPGERIQAEKETTEPSYARINLQGRYERDAILSKGAEKLGNASWGGRRREEDDREKNGGGGRREMRSFFLWKKKGRKSSAKTPCKKKEISRQKTTVKIKAGRAPTLICLEGEVSD